MSVAYKKIIGDGLWKNNTAFVQLLGLCPLLAVSTTLVNGLGMGLATVLVLTLSNTVVSIIRNIVRPEIRIPVFVMVIAAFVTTTELMMHAYLFELYQILGLFIPLIVTNCAIIARAEAFAAKNDVLRSATDGLMMGIGFTLALVMLGGLRELVAQGTILADAHLLFGEGARDWTIYLFGENFRGLLLAALPAGAFIGLGLLIALKNVIDAKTSKAQLAATPNEEPVNSPA